MNVQDSGKQNPLEIRKQRFPTTANGGMQS